MARKPGHWKTKDGREIPIVEMSDRHLSASINYLNNKLVELNKIAESNAKKNNILHRKLTLNTAFGAVYADLINEKNRRDIGKNITNDYIYDDFEITEPLDNVKIKGATHIVNDNVWFYDYIKF